MISCLILGSLYYLFFRLKDEILCVKIYANGEKFDIGAGKQFQTISDLILHYKKYPLKTNEGVDIHLDQVIHSHITMLQLSHITFIYYRELMLTTLSKTAQVAIVTVESFIPIYIIQMFDCILENLSNCHIKVLPFYCSN